MMSTMLLEASSAVGPHNWKAGWAGACGVAQSAYSVREWKPDRRVELGGV